MPPFRLDRSPGCGTLRMVRRICASDVVELVRPNAAQTAIVWRAGPLSLRVPAQTPKVVRNLSRRMYSIGGCSDDDGGADATVKPRNSYCQFGSSDLQ